MFWRRREPGDFGAEIEAHIQLEVERLVQQGVSQAEACRRARSAFGNATRAREQFQESQGWTGAETVLRDIRFGLRMLARHPASTAATAATLALVIGMNTAIFSVVHTALFRPLPVRHPEELVMLTDPDAFGVLGGVMTGPRYLLSYAEFGQLRERAASVSGLCASGLTLERWQVRVSGGAQEEARGRMVSGNYFAVFGVTPAIGHFFADDQGPYAVISYDYWQRRFGGSPAVLGTPVRFHQTTLTVTGVAPRGFRGETVGQNPDMWLPLRMQPLVMPGTDELNNDIVMWLHVFGRRKPGVTVAHVQAEMSALFRHLLEEKKSELNQRLIVRPAPRGVFLGRDAFSLQWAVLSALAALVLLLACANTASLLLARATGRAREIAIRLSIGASRGRLIRQLLTESLLLAALGGSMGILVAAFGSRTLTLLLSRGNEPLNFAAGFDGAAFAFTACATVLTGVLFGLAPALRTTRRVVTSSWQRARFARTLVIAQVALSLLLVVGAGLFLRTLWNLQSVALGYPADNLLLVELDPAGGGYNDARTIQLDHELAERVRAIPGVRGVTWSDTRRFSGARGVTAISVEGFTARDVGSNNGIYGYTLPYDDRGANREGVGPGYFSAIGIPMLAGREIGPQDRAGSPRICVINEAFAKRFFTGRNPIGKHITGVFSDNDHRTMEVVGVARNARDYTLRGNVEAKFYFPADQDGGGANLEIRTAGDPNRLFHAVRRAIQTVDAELPVKGVETLRQVVAAQNAQPQLIARLCTIFGALALLLAASGVYSVLSHGVARRTNEIGIRMALGAGRRQMAGMILRETGMLMLAGVTAGLAATAAGARLVAAQLYGLSAMDPLTIAAAVGILAAVALAAAYFPAARAARVDPLRALRHE